VAVAALGALAVTVAVLAFAWHNPGAPLPFADRLAATLRADILVVVWLVLGIGHVARLRFVSPQDIGGGEAQSPTVAEGRVLLQNTLEQVVLAIAAQLIVTATFERSSVLVLALVSLFALGRLLFWIGYRRGAAARAFGFGLSFYPSILALLGSGGAMLAG
jgi:hypothetical protein